MKRSIQMIAADLGTSRQYIDQTIKRAMRKVFKGVSLMNPDSSPFEVTLIIAKMFKVVQDADFEKFFTDFPEDIRRKIMADALTKTKLSNKLDSLETILNHNVRSIKNTKSVYTQ